MSERTFLQVALEDHNERWELLRGALRRKPAATFGCSRTVHEIGFAIMKQIDRTEWHSRLNGGYLKVSEDTYYSPDGFVIPVPMVGHGLAWDELEHYAFPMPLLIEVWPRYTREYAWEHREEPVHRIKDYQQRGDEEIWLAHSYTHRLTAWRRRSDGGYTRTIHESGIITSTAVPVVTIDLDALFAE